MTAAEPLPTRERLLAAAVELFLERGYDGTTVGEIARRAGVTTGAICAHFDDKGALLAEARAAEAFRAQRRLAERFPPGRRRGSGRSGERRAGSTPISTTRASGPSSSP